MYKSPIEVFTQINDMAKQIQEQQENYVYQCVQNVGVNVNKEELIKALQYDREQYKKGYADGVEEFAERLKCNASILCDKVTGLPCSYTISDYDFNRLLRELLKITSLRSDI